MNAASSSSSSSDHLPRHRTPDMMDRELSPHFTHVIARNSNRGLNKVGPGQARGRMGRTVSTVCLKTTTKATDSATSCLVPAKRTVVIQNCSVVVVSLRMPGHHTTSEARHRETQDDSSPRYRVGERGIVSASRYPPVTAQQTAQQSSRECKKTPLSGRHGKCLGLHDSVP